MVGQHVNVVKINIFVLLNQICGCFKINMRRLLKFAFGFYCSKQVCDVNIEMWVFLI